MRAIQDKFYRNDTDICRGMEWNVNHMDITVPVVVVCSCQVWRICIACHIYCITMTLDVALLTGIVFGCALGKPAAFLGGTVGLVAIGERSLLPHEWSSATVFNKT